jgi:hypothetical protein
MENPRHAQRVHNVAKGSRGRVNTAEMAVLQMSSDMLTQ